MASYGFGFLSDLQNPVLVAELPSGVALRTESHRENLLMSRHLWSTLKPKQPAYS